MDIKETKKLTTLVLVKLANSTMIPLAKLSITLIFYAESILAADLPPRLMILYKDINIKASKYQIDPAIVTAIIFQESGGKPDAREYSNGYRYFYKPDVFAKKHNISLETEMEEQRVSYGLMQVKCSTSRYLGFSGKCQNLYNAQMNMEYGVRYLAYLKDRFELDLNMISAYNQGYPYKLPNGKFRNYRYVDSVMNLYRRFKVMFPKPNTPIFTNSILKENATLVPFDFSNSSFSPVNPNKGSKL